MSLSVDVFVVGDDGKWDVLDVPEGCSDLAGFESWRRTVWGSEAVRSLGARFFPVLASEDILEIWPGELSAFVEECALLRSNLGLISRDAAASAVGRELDQEEAVSRRLTNIEDAAARAQRVGGGVVVW